MTALAQDALQPSFRKDLTPEEVERYFVDLSAQCLKRLLELKRSPEDYLRSIVELQVIHGLLTAFGIAQQDEVAHAKWLEERRREAEAQDRMEIDRQSEQRMRRSARPVG